MNKIKAFVSLVYAANSPIDQFRLEGDTTDSESDEHLRQAEDTEKPPPGIEIALGNHGVGSC